MDATPLYISVDTMAAGPELDMLVAERVMGWRNVCDCCFMGPTEVITKPNRHECTSCEGEVWYQLDKQFAEWWAENEQDNPNGFLDMESVRRHGTAIARVDQWHPSTDIATAMTLADRWEGALDMTRSRSGNWSVRLMDGEVVAMAYSRTLPLAICRAALKAVLPVPEVEYSDDDED